MKMKDFNYRIFDNNTKQYIEYDEVTITNLNFRINFPKYIYEECEIELYAGLKDSKGKKIYEGDIVISDCDDQKVLVKFEPSLGFYGCPLKYVGTRKESNFNITFVYDKWTIVGNIHDKEFK